MSDLQKGLWGQHRIGMEPSSGSMMGAVGRGEGWLHGSELWPRKHEALSSNAQHPHKKLGMIGTCR